MPSSVLILGRTMAPTDVPRLWAHVRALLHGRGTGEVVCDVGALVDPDASTVDALARLQLAARRHRCRIRLRGECVELRELVGLMGLGEVLPHTVGLLVEPSGQAEEGEQPRRVEEEGDPGDAIV